MNFMDFLLTVHFFYDSFTVGCFDTDFSLRICHKMQDGYYATLGKDNGTV